MRKFYQILGSDRGTRDFCLQYEGQRAGIAGKRKLKIFRRLQKGDCRDPLISVKYCTEAYRGEQKGVFTIDLSARRSAQMGTKMNMIWIIPAIILAAGVLFLLMIMPRMTKKADMAPFREWLYAHRGLHDNETDAPENSMKAFQKAVDAGFGIELDIQLSRDRIPVVFHDFTLKRVCGVDGKVNDYTYEELQQFKLCQSQEHIPGLEEVLKLVDGRVPLIIEFKIAFSDLSLCPIADSILREYSGRYCMESFNPLGVCWYRRHHREIARGQLSDAFIKEGEYSGMEYFVLQNLLGNFLAKPDFIAYNHRYPEVLARRICRDMYHSTAAAWTIKSAEELTEARKHFDLFIFDSFLPEERK